MGRGFERLASTFAERRAEHRHAGWHDDHLRTFLALLEGLSARIIDRNPRRRAHCNRRPSLGGRRRLCRRCWRRSGCGRWDERGGRNRLKHGFVRRCRLRRRFMRLEQRHAAERQIAANDVRNLLSGRLRRALFRE